LAVLRLAPATGIWISVDREVPVEDAEGFPSDTQQTVVGHGKACVAVTTGEPSPKDHAFQLGADLG